MFHAVEAGRLVARSNACRRPTGTDLIKRPDLPRTNQRLPVAATRARRGRDTARIGASPNLVDRSRLHTPFIDDDRVIDGAVSEVVPVIGHPYAGSHNKGGRTTREGSARREPPPTEPGSEAARQASGGRQRRTERISRRHPAKITRHGLTRHEDHPTVRRRHRRRHIRTVPAPDDHKGCNQDVQSRGAATNPRFVTAKHSSSPTTSSASSRRWPRLD